MSLNQNRCNGNKTFFKYFLYIVFRWIAWMWGYTEVNQNPISSYLTANKIVSHFISSLVGSSFHEVLWCDRRQTFQKVQLFGPRHQDVFPQMWDEPLCSLASSVFCLGVLSWMPFLTIAESWTLTLAEGREVCSYLNVFLGLFVTFKMIRWCALRVILVGWPLLGRFTTRFLYLWITALTVVP